MIYCSTIGQLLYLSKIAVLEKAPWSQTFEFSYPAIYIDFIDLIFFGFFLCYCLSYFKHCFSRPPGCERLSGRDYDYVDGGHRSEGETVQ